VAVEPVQQVAEEPQQPQLTVLGEFEDVLDPRRSRMQARSRQLMVTELQGLESLFASVPKDAADRPKLMRRLSEGYVELEAAAARDRNEALQRSRQGAARTDAKKWKDEVTKAERIEMAASKAAVKYYSLLVQQYPQFCLSPNAVDSSKSTGCNDETLYYLGLEYLRQKSFDNGRKTFLQLLQQYPKSELAAPTYFVFGELFRNEAPGDPSKWPLAQQAYAEVVKYPTARILPAGLLRLGEAYEAQGDTAKAKATYKELLDKFPGTDVAARVPDAMR
jgi:TolA-binding protein